MRFLKISTIYDAAVNSGLPPESRDLTYPQLHKALTDLRFGWSDHHVSALRRMGEEAVEFYLVEAAVNAWAREHGITSVGRERTMSVLQGVITEFEPDIIFFQDLFSSSRSLRDSVRRVRPSATLVGWRAFPTSDMEELNDLDLILSSSPRLVSRFRHAGIRSEFLAHAFAPSIYHAHGAESRDVIVGFFGSLGLPSGPHADRHETIRSIMASVPLEIWSDVRNQFADYPFRYLLRRFAFRALPLARRAKGLARKMEILPLFRSVASWRADPMGPTLTQQFPGRTHPAVYGSEYYEMLGRSQIVLNTHNEADKDALNMRDFEATGMGACLLTDVPTTLGDFFEVGTEVVGFRSPSEVPELVAELLQDTERRAAIAAAGQARTFQDHTYDKRASDLVQVLEKSVS